MPEPVQQFAVLTQYGTFQQWLEWLGKQVSGVANRMEAEQRKEHTRTEQLLTTTEELDKARNRIRSLEEELARVKELTTIMANMSHNTSEATKLQTG